MPISTLIVDDSIIYRKILSEVVNNIPELTLSGTAASGVIALKKMAQTKADLILLDINMPEMDGIETLKKIKEQFSETTVVMISGVNTQDTESTIKALEIGAIHFIKKPDGNNAQENFNYLVDELKYVIRLINLRRSYKKPSIASTAGVVEKIKREDKEQVIVSIKKEPSFIPTRFSVVAIGVSTGGPEALNRVIPQIPQDFPIPVLIVQHMPPFFTKSLADSLNRKSKIKVVEAQDNQIAEPKTVYIAPGGKHMTVQWINNQHIIKLNDDPPENSCKPSVDVLFRSVANAYKDMGILCVILTGMGSDGCEGVKACKKTYCMCITQSEKTCVVYGMPKAVDDEGLSDISLPLDEIASYIISKVKR